jgi:hypothetical protein
MDTTSLICLTLNLNIMKRRLLLSGILLLFIASFTACKKDDEDTKPLSEKIVGKWQVSKIDVTTTTNSGSNVVSTLYSSSDYVDFKESGDVEISLGNARTVGTYSTDLNYRLHLDLTSKDLESVVNVITDKRLEFTSQVVGAEPRVTETYILIR